MANKKSEDFRKSVAEKFVAGLKKEGLFWKQGWKSDSLIPSNAKSGAAYKGINRLNLFFTAKEMGYDDTRWMTFNQIRDAGYHLEKGSKGAKVEYWYPYDRINRESLTWKKFKEQIKAGRKEEEFALLVKMHTVFNGDNIEGLPEKEVFENKEVKPDQIIQTLSENMGVPIFHEATEDRAYYSPGRDEVHLPNPETFLSTSAYNATALHELAHATGHRSRLDRDQTGKFGSEKYAFEELTAEMTAVFMSVHTGIDPMNMDVENHQAYVNSWIAEIEKSPEVLVKALK